MASDLPRSHTDLPKIPSRLPECKSKCKSRRNRRHKSQSKNSIVGRQAVQANDHIDTKQEKLWVVRPTHETYLDQLVGHPVGPPLSEAAFPVIQSALGPSARTRSAGDSSSRGPSARSSSSSVVVPSSPA